MTTPENRSRSAEYARTTEQSDPSVMRRFKVCGCYFDEPCDEARHQRNADEAATALGWSLHESEVNSQ